MVYPLAPNRSDMNADMMDTSMGKEEVIVVHIPPYKSKAYKEKLLRMVAHSSTAHEQVNNGQVQPRW